MMRNTRYRYLYQLIITSIILVIIPLLFFYSVVWKKAINEMDYVNNEYYANTLESFSEQITNEIIEFKSQIMNFSAKSRTSQADAGIFYWGTKRMEDQAYHYWNAAKTLSEYGQRFECNSISIYYYEKDLILSNQSKYTLDRYINDGLRIVADRKESVSGFFSIDKFEDRKVMLAPLYDEEGVSTECLVGVCTTLGRNKEKALMFYRLDNKDNQYSNSDVWGEGSKYYILDTQNRQIAYSVGASNEDYSEITSVLNEKDDVFEILKEETEYYVKSNKNMGIMFVLDASEDSIQHKVINLYASVRVFFAYVLIVMLIICILVVYINYRPLQTLLEKIGHKHKGQNEFAGILSVWEKQNTLLTERRMAIIDLLMNHLLCNNSISNRYLEKLGVSDEISKYCVFVIKNYVLKVAEMDELTRSVEEMFGVLLFVNDLIDEKGTVCIAFMKEDQSEIIKEWMSSWCQMRIGTESELKNGDTVDKLSDIQKSFKKCIALGDETERVQSINENTEQNELLIRKRIVLNDNLKEKILQYINDNFMDRELSQSQVADQFEISVYSLSKMFNSQVGIGFVEYVNVKRIDYAKELLLTTEKNVKEIALMVGFAGSKYFTEIFKRYTGMTPGGFRSVKNNK